MFTIRQTNPSEMPDSSAGSMKRVGVRGCINIQKRSQECERGTQECVRHSELLRFGLPLEQTLQNRIRIQALGFRVEV